MLILLKLLCFTVWMVIILYLVGGSHNSFQGFTEVKITVNDEENLERNISSALARLKKNDRLIIEFRGNLLNCRRNQIILRSILRKNPSLGYYYGSENWSC